MNNNFTSSWQIYKWNVSKVCLSTAMIHRKHGHCHPPPFVLSPLMSYFSLLPLSPLHYSSLHFLSPSSSYLPEPAWEPLEVTRSPCYRCLGAPRRQLMPMSLFDVHTCLLSLVNYKTEVKRDCVITAYQTLWHLKDFKYQPTALFDDLHTPAVRLLY